CWVWGLSYTGNLTAMVGQNATSVALSDGCFDLSDNFVVVFRDSVDAGIIKSANNGPDDLYVCYNDPTAPTAFRFDSLGHVGPNFAYVVTDNNGTILGLPPGDMVDFAGAGPGECWVWGLSYTGNLTAMLGQNATSVALSDGCFDLSDNFIRVFRDSLDGGMVASELGPDTLLVCYSGGTPTTYSFDSLLTSGNSFTYVVTDDNGVILGIPPADMVDFAGAGPGECWVWGLSYSGTLTAAVGDTATQVALSDGCFDLSDNFIVVLRDSSGAACGMNIAGPPNMGNVVAYPNPSTDIVNLYVPATDLVDNQLSVSIYKMDGQRAISFDVTVDTDIDYQTQISIEGLEQGYYILRIQNGSASHQTVLVRR
ncbi:MAG: T9SS type A sorting domain-containing protein, partial [Bacteroidia bacterium]|nr:T9SS type A sorting domain-containing protein [Bacteroidia bacterium]